MTEGYGFAAQRDDTLYECLTCGERLEGWTLAMNHTMFEHGQAGRDPDDRFTEIEEETDG